MVMCVCLCVVKQVCVCECVCACECMVEQVCICMHTCICLCVKDHRILRYITLHNIRDCLLLYLQQYSVAPEGRARKYSAGELPGFDIVTVSDTEHSTENMEGRKDRKGEK